MIRHTAYVSEEASSLCISVTAATNEPLSQIWDEAAAAYIPDRTILPLILVPSVTDLDGHDLTSQCTERAWYRIDAAGKEIQITSSTPGHTLWPTGYPLGLKIAENVTPTAAVAKYVLRIRAAGVRAGKTVELRTRTAAAPAPRLEIDAPPAQDWDPFTTDADRVTVTPRVIAHGKKCTIRWRRIQGTSRIDIDLTDPLDAELSLDTATSAITIDRRIMGEQVTLVCELLCGTQIVAERPLTIRRRIPPFRAEIEAATYFSATDRTVHAAIAVSKEPGGRIATPGAELRTVWYSGDKAVAEGDSHDFPAAAAKTVPIGAEVTDRGPWCIITDADGTALTDADGTLLITR